MSVIFSAHLFTDLKAKPDDPKEIWDLYAIAKIMQGHLKEVFAPCWGLSEHEGKELLKNILQAANRPR